jgi:flagellar basal body rod protein FlgC
MALDRIASSALRAQTRALDDVAHNVSQLGVRDAQLVRTRFESEAPPPRGPGGVRAHTDPVSSTTSRASSAPLLSPEVDESFVRDDLDLAQELTNALVARHAFQINAAVHRAAGAFVEATLNIGA